MNNALGASTRGFVLIAVMALLLPLAARGEVRSGIWTYVDGGDTIASRPDFSVLASFCATEGGGQRCSLKVADCYFKFDTIFAPNGVWFDSSVSAGMLSQFVSGKTITRTDREGLFYLDSMMKKIALKAPQSGFRNSIPARSGVFFVKTSENRNAVMVKLGQYIGAIDRTWYYWAYQPDSSDALFKSRLIQSASSTLTIAVDAFSGRPNPSFPLTDSAAVALIAHEALVSVNQYLDSTVHRNNTEGCPERLGYRRLTVYGIFDPETPVSSYMPNIEICAGKITYYKSSAQPLYFYDKGSLLEKLIIRVACEKNLTTTDSYGTTRLCDVVPDSLKPITPSRQATIPEGNGNRAVQCRVRHHEIQFHYVPPGEARFDCFSLTGKCVASITRKGIGEGAFTVDVRDFSIGTGAYILRLSPAGLKTRNMVFPVLLYR